MPEGVHLSLGMVLNKALLSFTHMVDSLFLWLLDLKVRGKGLSRHNRKLLLLLFWHVARKHAKYVIRIAMTKKCQCHIVIQLWRICHPFPMEISLFSDVFNGNLIQQLWLKNNAKVYYGDVLERERLPHFYWILAHPCTIWSPQQQKLHKKDVINKADFSLFYRKFKNDKRVFF